VVPLLERLAKRRTPLAVKLNNREEFSSCIVDVDRQHVLLDELLPSSGHALLLSKRKLQIIAKLDGIDICFDTTLERVDTQDKLVTYYAKLPGQIEYGQRRLDFRVHIPMTKKLRVIIDNADGSVFEGVLHDLSHGGAAMVFPGGKPNVTAGLLHNCAIELSDYDWLYTTVELRYSKRITFRDRQLIGARFTDAGPAQAQLIRQHLCELQRELLRKRAAD
jgi:c-di-GMP-binding flagellar brake protein YcgR